LRPRAGPLDKIDRLASAVSIDARGSAAAVHPSALAARTRARRSRWWVEALAVGWLLWLYDSLANFAPLRLHAAIDHAWGVLHAEQALHLAPELALDHWADVHRTIGLILSDYYDNAHFLVTLGLLGWLWWKRADIYRPLRNSLVAVNLIGFVVFWRYPVAPPRMLGGFADVVASTHAFGSSHSGPLASQADQVAAMPSLHMAWAAWCGLALWRISARRWVRVLAVAHPCLTALAVLATGNHFLLDVLAGLGALALATLLVRVAHKVRSPRVPHVTNLLRSLGPGRLNGQSTRSTPSTS
jgi:PAP2 superfamily